MSDARDLFGPDPPREGSPVLRELALMRLLLEAIRTDVEAIRQGVEDAAAAPAAHPAVWEDAPPPAAGAPLAAGGGASYPGFPSSFRRTGGGG